MLIFLWSVTVVVLAEMADKTQLLAMAFATRFRARSVMAGVLIATVANHALAVAVGDLIGTKANVQVVQIVAAASFILFGLWTLRGDSLHGEEKRTTRFGPIVTVAIAFFIAEMGDKTQLATAALAAKYHAPLFVLAGSTVGMLIADAIGIYVGVVAGKRLPERVLKWGSALIFIGFGYMALYASVPRPFVSVPYAAALVALTAAGIWAATRWGRRKDEARD